MNVVVITPPAALVAPADVKTRLRIADDDAFLTALIAVAQAQIEPTESWVGRAFGLQTLEMRLDGRNWPTTETVDLAFPPLVSVSHVKYDDDAGAEQTLAPAEYRVSGIGAVRGLITPSPAARALSVRLGPEAIRIRYQAGYDATDPRLEPAKQAVVLAVSQLRNLARDDIFLKRETTEGIGTIEWAVSEAATKVIERAITSLLTPYRVCAL